MDLRSLLERAEAAAPVDVVDAIGAALLEMVGASDVSFLITDFSGLSLTRLGHTRRTPGAGGDSSRETAERVPLLNSPQGEALARQQVVLVRDGGGDGNGDGDGDQVRLLCPVTSRGEAVGVLELVLPYEPAPETVGDVELAAHQLAYLIIANRRYTDLYEWGQRTVPLSLAAEIQRRLLPASFTCEAGQFTLAGWLEPAAEVSGDTFDFSLDRDALHLSMTDAMGHSVASAMLATILLGSLRNSRRGGRSLQDQADRAHRALIEHAPEGGFVTGQLVRVDLRSNTARIVNAGHPLPFRIRDGKVEQLQLSPDTPFGAIASSTWREQDLPLEAGDRLVFLTDGLLERNAAGLDLPGLLDESRGLHPRDAIQHLIRAVLEASGGSLQDDAAALCLDWIGGPPRERSATAGARDEPADGAPEGSAAEPSQPTTFTE